MRFRLGMITGFAVGYYAGAKAGRQRYDQINRAIRRVRRSDAVDAVTDAAAEKAKTAVQEGVGKGRDLVDSRTGNGGDLDLPPDPFK